jgi:hypothetical protein
VICCAVFKRYYIIHVVGRRIDDVTRRNLFDRPETRAPLLLLLAPTTNHVCGYTSRWLRDVAALREGSKGLTRAHALR